MSKKMNEYVDLELLEGFIQDKMGISYDGIPRYKSVPFKTELDQIIDYKKKYQKSTKSILVSYRLPKHKWGRITPNNHLSLCVFHRPTRHSLCEEYIDLDLENCQPSILLQFCNQFNLTKPNLKKYVETPVDIRTKIMEFYQINKHAAKDLFIRLLFGGSYQTWLNDNLLDEKIDFVIDFENEIKDLIEIV